MKLVSSVSLWIFVFIFEDIIFIIFEASLQVSLKLPNNLKTHGRDAGGIYISFDLEMS